MATYAEFDTSNFPVVLVRFTGEAATTAYFESYLQTLEQCYRSGEKLGIIFDATNAVLPKLQYQNMQAQWLRNNGEMIRSHCVGTAYVITKPVIRTMLKLIFALQEQPTPYMVARNVQDAHKWINEKLSEAEK